MTPRTLLKDIALRAGVHQATVSRALRDDSRIRPEVRERLRELAREMGYTPDPHLRALAKYRASRQPAGLRGRLAWLTNFPRRDGWRRHEKIEYLTGARTRAAELGYDIETVWAREPGITPGRLNRILRARGVGGLLLPPQPQAETRMELDLAGLAAVSFGHGLAAPRLHVVHSNHYRSMQTLLGRLAELGYRRPGLALTTLTSHNVNGGWLAAYLHAAHELGGGWPAPLLGDAWGPRELVAWKRREKPDVIVSEREETLAWLREAGVRPPRGCGFALTARHPGQPDCSGMDENSELAGAAAIDLLTGMIERGQTGEPASPMDILIAARWREAKTPTVRQSDPALSA